MKTISTKNFLAFICAFNLLIPSGEPQETELALPSLEPIGFVTNQFQLRLMGDPNVDYQIDGSTNLTNWIQLLLSNSPSGTFDFFDTNVVGLSERFYRAAIVPEITYQGSAVLLIDQVPEEFGAGAKVQFDLDGDGMFEAQVTADDGRLFTISLDTSSLGDVAFVSQLIQSSDGMLSAPVTTLKFIRSSPENPAGVIPLNLALDPSAPPTPSSSLQNALTVPTIEPSICSCVDCPPNATMLGFSLEGYTQSYTPTVHGTELVSGKLRWSFPVLAFGTRILGFNFNLHHTSLISYNGAFGQSVSHSFNMMIIQTNANSGQIITPDLRVYDIQSEDGRDWLLPEGFYSRLQLDSDLHRWTLTHFSGLETTFYQATAGVPGYPIQIREPNGNATTLTYNHSGFLQQIVTDLSQVQRLQYDNDSRLSSITDHIGRTWNFVHDDDNRLTQVQTPVTAFANIPPELELTDTGLVEFLLSAPRTTVISYDPEIPNHLRSITDQRGATPMSWSYDGAGRVDLVTINGQPQDYVYAPAANPVPLPKLEPLNNIVRVVDRESNIVDYEIHSSAGGPVGGDGKFGIRRQITWTEKGKGKPALRETEPLYWEQRILQDCDCLAPQIVTQEFSSDDKLEIGFDGHGIPENWPRNVYEYNTNRQVTGDLYTDGNESIKKSFTYQPFSFGDNNQYSRLLSETDPREFDDNSIYTGLSFVHTYQYDTAGNRVLHNSPTITRGVDLPQTINESWTYNEFGQLLSHTDPNGNLMTYSYYSSTSSGGDINTKGSFGGYLASVTRGATGSSDSVTDLTTTHNRNALGMATQTTDPNGFVYDYIYNDLGELIQEIEPNVTLRNNTQVRYHTVFVYDGAGNRVMERRSNIDLDGVVLANEEIDRAMSYDSINNLLSERVEVDGNDANDLTTQYAYDKNDQLSVIAKPEGNRTFHIYDERILLYKTFYGIEPGIQIDASYPAIKQVQSLGGTDFVGLTVHDYDARRNLVRTLDGRGYFTHRSFDFFNREVAESDQNGNGWVAEFDDASYLLTKEGGEVSALDGSLTRGLNRAYGRFDELGRLYQQVLDIDLTSDERADIDPEGTANSSYEFVYDRGSRVTINLDANGNSKSTTYDADDRKITSTDALSNMQTYTYDLNSNIITLTETEVAGPNAIGSTETYETTYTYDELNRRVEQHIRGLNGNSIDHATFTAYDSRHNVRLIEDANQNFELIAYDDHNRLIQQQRFDGDPILGTPIELKHMQTSYDRNSRRAEYRVFSNVTNPISAQITRYAYDNLDRVVRTVYPDSDDPIDGTTNGADGFFDRVETTYDENSNPTTMTDQRGVLITNEFDPGNRLTDQNITLPPGVPGTTKQRFSYDALNRRLGADNNYASVFRSYDPFSRITGEATAVALDGTGFVNGYQDLIVVLPDYDKQSNKTGYKVRDINDNIDIAVTTGFDPLNRPDHYEAEYLGLPKHTIADYSYFGPVRIQQKTLGNGAQLTNLYDVKRRMQSHQWQGSFTNTLVGFGYDYDDVDNMLFEQFRHDNNHYDHFVYNNRYEIVGATYRSSSASRPVVPNNIFGYDDNYNRTQAFFSLPFDSVVQDVDTYVINEVNEYIQITRNGSVTNPRYDLAGNTTRLPALPVTGFEDQSDVQTTNRWDGLNCLFDAKNGVNSDQHYRYDALRRRIATLAGPSLTPVRRYIYDGWSVVEERLFDSGSTVANVSSTLERVYVNGPKIDEVLLMALDRDQDGALGGDLGKNQRDIDADQEYYYLYNRLGNVMGILDADNPDRLLEYYRYSIYGEAVVLPTIEDGNGLELTPLDLSDNAAGDPQQFSEEFGNVYLFTGRRFDDLTGMYYYRNRYYESRTGRFLSRDPIGYLDLLNLYPYVHNNPLFAVDPDGHAVVCVGISGAFVFVAGAGGNLSYCSDECGNWAIVLFASARLGAEIGLGIGGSGAKGGLKGMLSGPSYDVSAGLGPVSGGIDFDSKGSPSGGHGSAGPSKFDVGASAGAGGAAMLTGDLSKPYPCPPPKPKKPKTALVIPQPPRRPAIRMGEPKWVIEERKRKKEKAEFQRDCYERRKEEERRAARERARALSEEERNPGGVWGPIER